MLCNSKINKRPDKQLKKHLVMLAYALVCLSASLISLFIYPEYFMILVLLTLIFITLSLIITINTLNTAETAMSYGGFANEILRSESKLRRIENSDGQAVIENALSEELFKQYPVLSFLEHYLSEENENKAAFQRIKNACANLNTEQAEISLFLHEEENKIFSNEEWFLVNVRPIYLKKADIFNGPFSIKAIKKETHGLLPSDYIIYD